MIKFYALIVLLFIIFTFPCIAQSKKGRVEGYIKSTDGSPINAATISLLRAKDSALAKAVIADKTGNFEIENVADGNYLVKITAVGYSPYLSNPFIISDANYNVSLSTLTVRKSDKQLENVQVTVKRPLIENRIDKLVLNVEAAISNAGSTAMDVLEKSPGVSVDRDGNITLKGKQGVIILMDGKPTYLSVADLTTLLRNTPANQLDQIEIMTQPSAKYDASGNSGIINIKTKKNQQSGFNGSISLSYVQGVYPKTNNSFTINSRKGKVNLFANAGVSYNEGFSKFYLTRNFHDKNTAALTSVFDQETSFSNISKSGTFKGGIDFFASKKTTFGIVANTNNITGHGTGVGSANIYNGTGILTSVNVAESRSNFDWASYSGNFNFRHLIDTAGTEITADFDLIKYSKTNPSDNDNYTYDSHNNLIGYPYLLRGELPSDITISTGKIDYVHPLKNKMKLEAGVKASWVETVNDAQYNYYDFPSASLKIDGRTNNFEYSENITAVYVNTSRQMKKWSLQLGLRLENTIAQGKQLVNNQTFEKKYIQLFPTAYFSHTPNKKNTYVLSYGRRIDRPNYQDMNPFQYFLDQYTYKEGNPFLTPQFTHNIEISQNYKGILNSAVNYTRTTDLISDVFVQNDSARTTVYTKQNIATRRNIGLSMNYNKALNKIWNLTFSANVYNNYFNGIINKAHLSLDYTTFQVNATNQFKFNKGWSAEMSGLYNYKTLQSISITQPNGMINLGAAKQIWKNKATLRLTVRDLFYTMYYNSYTKFDNMDMKTKIKWDNRQAALSFTYRFGKNTNAVPQRKRTSASQEEQNRVGTGN